MGVAGGLLTSIVAGAVIDIDGAIVESLFDN